MKARTFYTAALMSACALSGVSIAQAMQDSKPVTFRIDAPSMTEALLQFTQQSHLQLAYSGEKPLELKAPKVEGTLTPKAALDQLLKGTGLQYEFVNDRTVSIRKADSKPTNSDSTTWVASDGSHLRLAQAEELRGGAFTDSLSESGDASSAGPAANIEQVTVTGTYIRGAAPSGSPLKYYTRDEMVQSGAATLSQFGRQMAGNFSNADSIANQNSNINLAKFGNSGGGAFEGASFNLHGLGTGSTLTLLNGHRLAPSGYDGSLTDSSQIPLSAVDRMEVLPDGSSAIYGADAVAGVVNVITRKDFNGAETGLRYGTSTAGGATQITASQLLGHSWSTGSVLGNYEYNDERGLDASERDYIGSQGGPYSLIPKSRRNSVFVAASQSFDSKTTVSADVLFSSRDFASKVTQDNDFQTLRFAGGGRSNQLNTVLTLARLFAADWRASLTGTYSRVRQRSDSDYLIQAPLSPDFTFANRVAADSDLAGVEFLVDGPLVEAPGGSIKAAVGGSFRGEKFTSENAIDGAVILNVPALQRHVSSVYTEVSIPIVGASNAVSGVKSIDISAAIRYDKYSDFGSTANPKFGLSYSPVAGLKLRATHGRSFRAPQLNQLGEPVNSSTQDLADPTSATGVTDTLTLGGGNAGLRAEKARSLSVGFDLMPETMPGFRLSGTYFHISFQDRIATPPVVGANYFVDPALETFVVRNPSLSDVQRYFDSPGFLGDSNGSGPEGVGAIFDGRYSNIASTKVAGFNISAEYGVSIGRGKMNFLLDVDRLQKNNFQPVSGQPAVVLVNTFGQVPRLKGHAGLAWTIGDFRALINANYINSYLNTLTTPAARIASYTTEDLNLTYEMNGIRQSPWAGGLTLAVSVQNITNSRPPFVEIVGLLPGQNPIPFDPANASPVGRLLALRVEKRF